MTSVEVHGAGCCALRFVWARGGGFGVYIRHSVEGPKA